LRDGYEKTNTVGETKKDFSEIKDERNIVCKLAFYRYEYMHEVNNKYNFCTNISAAIFLNCKEKVNDDGY
jgi:hypothetical protein